MKNIAVLGHGVVGSGVMEVLIKNKDKINRELNDEINVKYVLDLREFNDLPYADKFTKNVNDILDDDEVSIVVEVMGGAQFAYECVKKALKLKKHVVTSNKELVAKHGVELLEIAKENNVNFLFEASTGGGIPVIGSIIQSFAANNILKVCGILNGTTNYILSKMESEGISFDEALDQAKKLGYAESDPSADILGLDTMRKISILSSLCFGKQIDLDLIKVKGIENITIDDIKAAKLVCASVKLIGKTYIESGKIFIQVAPFAVMNSDPLANVNDVYNAIKITGDMVGEIMLYGAGAGKLPTASAVVNDIVDCVKNFDKRIDIGWEKANDDLLLSSDEVKQKFLVCVDGNDDIKAAFKADEYFETEKKLVFITDFMLIEEVENKLKELTDKGSVKKIYTLLPVLD